MNSEGKEFLAKLMRYCAIQERCKQEVYQKLSKLSCPKSLEEPIIIELENLNFLSEQRFAQAFARGKFEIKSWGKQKIFAELSKKGIANDHIKLGLEEIEEKKYLERLDSLIERKHKELSVKERYNRMELKQRILKYAMQKGYEFSLVMSAVDRLLFRK
ncbi:MAG: RecX family transcriptional regulator [Flavobacteriales bacterium]|nr:RecX family transcriptional regulator [Flavobacteriales bacterium]